MPRRPEARIGFLMSGFWANHVGLRKGAQGSQTTTITHADLGRLQGVVFVWILLSELSVISLIRYGIRTPKPQMMICFRHVLGW